MARTITKQHAEKIVKKLRAVVEQKRKAHDVAYVFHKKQLVASFGIRRGSSKDAGHNHIPEDLHLTLHQTLDLAQCPLSYERWIEILTEKGYIAKEEEDGREERPN